MRESTLQNVAAQLAGQHETVPAAGPTNNLYSNHLFLDHLVIGKLVLDGRLASLRS